MGTFTIKAQQPKYQVRFQEAAPEPAAEAKAASPATCLSSDRLCLSGRKVEAKAPDTLEIFDNTPKAETQRLMDRMTTRQSSVSVGPRQLQLEVGTESAAPELITSAKEPDQAAELQSKIANIGKSSGEQVIRTGAVIQPVETLQIQVGMASAVDAGKLMQPQPKGDKEDSAIRPGMYAGVAVKTQAVSTRLAVDTAFGKPRVEVGTALAAGELATFGVSYQQSAVNENDPQRTLRVGGELKAAQDTVVGVSVNQPLAQGTQVSGQTAVSVYLNAKFD